MKEYYPRSKIYGEHNRKDFDGISMVGFVHRYLQNFGHKKSRRRKSEDEIDLEVFTKLVQLDTKLSITVPRQLLPTASQQLYRCLQHTTRSDIIKVWIFAERVDFNSFLTIDVGQINAYEVLRRQDIVGFAHFYLKQFVESKSAHEIDVQIYNKLVKVDSKLGTAASEQLRWCLEYTTRSDIIKVYFLHQIRLNINLDYRL